MTIINQSWCLDCPSNLLCLCLWDIYKLIIPHICKLMRRAASHFVGFSLRRRQFGEGIFVTQFVTGGDWGPWCGDATCEAAMLFTSRHSLRCVINDISITASCQGQVKRWDAVTCHTFRLLKTLVWQACFARGGSAACQPPCLILLPSCRWNGQSWRKTSGDPLSSVFLVKPVSSPLFPGRSFWRASRAGEEEVRLIKACARAWANKQGGGVRGWEGGDYFSTHDSANSEWIKSDPAHSADKPNPPSLTAPLAFCFLC